MSVYRVNCSTTPQQRFKIRANAEVSLCSKMLLAVLLWICHFSSLLVRLALENPHLSPLNVAMRLQELHMTGCAVITDTVAVIVVEGGAKAQKKYAHVVQNRIKWAPDEEEDTTEDRSVAYFSKFQPCSGHI